MSEPSYPPQTVAAVALGSLIGGFVLVFGGGMLLLRPHAVEAPGAAPTRALPPPSSSDASAPLADPLAPSSSTRDAHPSSSASSEPEPGSSTSGTEPSTSTTTGSVTVGAPSISRCFDAGPPNPIPGPNCGQLDALQQHIASRSTQIAACGRGARGRLVLFLDFRFSTTFVRGWGSPASTIARAGDVTSCVKTAIFPLPFAQMPHDHDRYILTVPIDY